MTQIIINVIFLGIGLVVVLSAKIALIVEGFRTSTKWGLGLLLLPFASFFFRKEYPDEASGPMKWGLVGTILVIASSLSLGSRIDELKKTVAYLASGGQVEGSEALPTPDPEAAAPPPVEATPTPTPVPTPPLNRMQAMEMEDLKQWRENLEIQRQSVDPKDAVGVQAYNAELQRYSATLQEWLQRVRQEQGLESVPPTGAPASP